MRQLVYFSLKNAAIDCTQVPDNPRERFNKFAGPVILGHGLHPCSIEARSERKFKTNWSRDKEKRSRNRVSPGTLTLQRKVELNLRPGEHPYSTKAGPIDQNKLTRRQKKKIWWSKNFKLDENRFGIRWERRKRQSEQTQKLNQNKATPVKNGLRERLREKRKNWWRKNWYSDKKSLEIWRTKQEENKARQIESRNTLTSAFWKDYEKRRVRRLTSQRRNLPSQDARALQRKEASKLFRPMSVVVERAHRDMVPKYADGIKAQIRYKVPLLHKFLEQDLKLFKHWAPVKSFEEMLVEALEKDSEWRRDGQYKEEDMDWLAKNAVSTRVRMKGNHRYNDYEWR
jgi:hypothetical protein